MQAFKYERHLFLVKVNTEKPLNANLENCAYWYFSDFHTSKCPEFSTLFHSPAPRFLCSEISLEICAATALISVPRLPRFLCPDCLKIHAVDSLKIRAGSDWRCPRNLCQVTAEALLENHARQTLEICATALEICGSVCLDFCTDCPSIFVLLSLETVPPFGCLLEIWALLLILQILLQDLSSSPLALSSVKWRMSLPFLILQILLQVLSSSRRADYAASRELKRSRYVDEAFKLD